jgi:hypothetical protein
VRPWSVEVAAIRSIEVSPGVLRIGAHGTVTLTLASGRPIDLGVFDREEVADALARRLGS